MLLSVVVVAVAGPFVAVAAGLSVAVGLAT